MSGFTALREERRTMSFLSDFDLHLLAEGNHYRSYERLGAHVEAGSLSQQDVQVLLFDRGEDKTKANTASVGVADFDEQGVLKNWPFGFLAPPPTPVGKPLAQAVG